MPSPSRNSGRHLAAAPVNCTSIAHFETLEDRRLFSAAAGAAMTQAMPSHLFSAADGSLHAGGATIHYTKLHGTYSGTYTKSGHSYTFTLKVSQFTHTGHFSGTLTVAGTPVGSVTAALSGRITPTRQFFINFSGTGFSGTLTGQASHTGGHLKGTYTVNGLINASGPFEVGK